MSTWRRTDLKDRCREVSRGLNDSRDLAVGLFPRLPDLSTTGIT